MVETEYTDVARLSEKSLGKLPGLAKKIRSAPDHVLNACYEMVSAFEGFPNRPRMAERGLAWNRMLLAAVHLLKGHPKTAHELLQTVKDSPHLSAENLRLFLLRYYLATREVSPVAVALFLRVVTGEEPFESSFRRTVRSRLHGVCKPTPLMSPDELRDRVKWNRLAAKKLPKKIWPKLNEATAFFHMGRWDRAESVLNDISAGKSF